MVPLVPWACRLYNYRGLFFSASQREDPWVAPVKPFSLHSPMQGWTEGKDGRQCVGKEGLREGGEIPYPYPCCPACSQVRALGQAAWEDAVGMQNPSNGVIPTLGMFLGAKVARRGWQPRWGWVGFVSTVGECGWQSV